MVYIILLNMPRQIRTSHLRTYLDHYIEKNAFICFHLKHRKDLLIEGPNICCAIANIKDEFFQKFYEDFNGKKWTHNGRLLQRKCFVHVIHEQNKSDILKKYQVHNFEDLPEFKPPSILPQGNVGTPSTYLFDLIQKCRLPAHLIKKLGLKYQQVEKKYSQVPLRYTGKRENYTTETNIAKGLTQAIQISKSDNFTSNSNRKSKVKGKNNIIFSIKDSFVPSTSTTDNQNRDIENSNRNRNNSESLDDEYGEEWDRHCQFHDDVDKQERSKEQLFERDKEVVWDKGSSGLNWYTDAAFWDELEWGKGNVFEEKCPDDWDIDMSVYDNPQSADKDAQDLLSIQMKDKGIMDVWNPGRYNQTQKLNELFCRPENVLKYRKNIVDQYAKNDIFLPKDSNQIEFKPKNNALLNNFNINNDNKRIDKKGTHKFEAYEDKVVQGIGKILIQKSGWTEGQGLGKYNEGISEPLPIEGTFGKIGLGIVKYFDIPALKSIAMLPIDLPNSIIALTEIINGPRVQNLYPPYMINMTLNTMPINLYDFIKIHFYIGFSG